MFKSVLSLTLAAALGTASFGQTTLTAILVRHVFNMSF